MKKLFILDAVNYLFRSYYAIGPMTNPQGQSTSAVFGFIRSVQKLIKDFAPDHLVAVFDGPDNKKSRQTLFADYKAHRKDAPEDLFPQFDWATQFCHDAGIPTLTVEGVEADDTMASIAVWAEGQGADVFICSSDKDLMQLVDDKIKVVNVHKENLIYDAAKVYEVYGVRPDQVLDLLAMMGDASDNIPGLEGFGPKTAASLLNQFGTLDAILADPSQVKGAKKQEILRTQKDVALMSRELATLDRTVPIPEGEAFYLLKEPNRQALAAFYQEMNFSTLLRELDAQKPSAPAQTEYRLAPDFQTVLAALGQAETLCIDTETTDVRPMHAELVGLGFCAEPGLAYYVPYTDALFEGLKKFLSRYKGSYYGHNLKYDWHVLQNYGLDLKPIGFDTLVASYVLSPQSRKHSLDDLALEKFNKVKIPITDLIGKGKQQRTMREVPLEQIKEYCCEDVDYTARLKKLQDTALADNALQTLFATIEMPLLPILARMERRGIYVDAEELKRTNSEFSRQIDLLKAKIFEAVGEEFNLNSPQQLSRILYEKLSLKTPGKKPETSTAAAVLEQIADQHPVVSRILDYRTLEKLRSTYLEALPETIHPKTGRIHCTFNQSATATGRLSCQDPNLQNIPVRGKEGLRIRTCFKPQRADWSYVAADYSQIELRLLAHFSNDPELIAAFWRGDDIHTHTASLILGVPPSQVTPDLRAQAKAVNFGILYGQGPYGLSQQTGLSVKEASEFIKKYFERYPRVNAYIEECKQEAHRTGLAKTLTGRKRPLPELTNQNPSIRAAAERLAVNTPLQGTAADLIKLAMIEIDKAIAKQRLKGSMILQIHDELIFEVPDAEISAFEQLAKEKMESVFQLNIPLEVSIAVGKNWGEC